MTQEEYIIKYEQATQEIRKLNEKAREIDNDLKQSLEEIRIAELKKYEHLLGKRVNVSVEIKDWQGTRTKTYDVYFMNVRCSYDGYSKKFHFSGDFNQVKKDGEMSQRQETMLSWYYLDNLKIELYKGE